MNDRGHLLGDGVFETLRTHGDAVWQEARHRARMERGARIMGLDAGAWDDTLTDLLAQGSSDRRIRIQLTGGDMTSLTEGTGSRMTGSVTPFEPYPDTPVDVVTSDVVLPRQPWSGCKTLSMFPHMQALRMAQAQGADDALLTDGHGQVVEGTTSNVFAWMGGRWHSPGADAGAVDGVTRHVLMDHLDVVPSLAVERLRDVEALALTNTRGIRVAGSLDGRSLDTAPTTKLRDLFLELQP